MPSWFQAAASALAMLVFNSSEFSASADLRTGAVVQQAGTSTCGSGGTVPDCNHGDLGTCGNACCILEVPLSRSPEQVYSAVKGFLEGGGDSGAFSYVTGVDPSSGQNPGDDLRPFPQAKPFQYILQGKHVTSGKHYADTLNFNIKTGAEETSSVLRLFSISNIHGALGDRGQNYKTLVYLLDAAGLGRENLSIVCGCGKPCS